jgi:hypothetical protein
MLIRSVGAMRMHTFSHSAQLANKSLTCLHFLASDQTFVWSSLLLEMTALAAGEARLAQQADPIIQYFCTTMDKSSCRCG